MKLPAEVKAMLDQNAIGQEEAIFSALFDLSDSGEYENGYIVLMSDKLLVLRGQGTGAESYRLDEIGKLMWKTESAVIC